MRVQQQIRVERELRDRLENKGLFLDITEKKMNIELGSFIGKQIPIIFDEEEQTLSRNFHIYTWEQISRLKHYISLFEGQREIKNVIIQILNEEI